MRKVTGLELGVVLVVGGHGDGRDVYGRGCVGMRGAGEWCKKERVRGREGGGGGMGWVLRKAAGCLFDLSFLC